jgi:hypothetical protein
VVADIGPQGNLDEAAVVEPRLQRGEELIGFGKRRVDGEWSSVEAPDIGILSR